MGLTILEKLAGQKPWGMHVRNKSLALMYELVRKHQAEIEEALSRGYSWKQIKEACRASWQEESDKAAGISWWRISNLVESCYRAVKNGTSVGNSSPKEKRPLSLEVRVTKR